MVSTYTLYPSQCTQVPDTPTDSQKAVSQNAFKILIVDDHEAIINGTLPTLIGRYPAAQIHKARHLSTAHRVLRAHPNIRLIGLDLSIPIDSNQPAQRQVGLTFLRQFLKIGMGPNLVVYSTDIQPILCLRASVNAYEGGFGLVDKRQPLTNMLDAVDIALRGSIYWPQRTFTGHHFSSTRVDLDAQWLNALRLKFRQGLTDKAIARKLEVSDRTIRNYWMRLQDSLGIPEDPDRDPRIEIWRAVYELGLID